MRDKLQALCALNGVSGDEREISQYILDCVRGHADELVTDAMGNIIVFKKGAKSPDKKIMLCAHMDEVGIIVTDITDDGYIKFDCVGGIDRRVLLGKPVSIGEKRIYGVVGVKAVHLVRREEREKIPKVEDMYIDIGAKSREEAKKQVSLGDTGVFETGFVEFGDGFIKARAIDDRLGCVVLLNLIESELPADCWFAFTVQEEVGVRGAYTASYRVAPDIALIIEATTAADIPSVSNDKKVCRAGSGAVIPFMDGGAIYDRGLYKTLTGLAGENNIPWQTKNRIAGGTDAQAVQRSRAGVRTAAIAAPVRNLHSPSCVGKLSDFEAVNKLAMLFLEKMGEG